MPAEEQQITIPPIVLQWTDWYSWNDLKAWGGIGKHGLGKVKQPGVYEVKLKESEKRLTIGRTSCLRRRIQTDLLRDNGTHSEGKKIRANQDPAMLVLRWALTDRPAAVEEELHKQHVQDFDGFPEYTHRT